MKKSVLQPFDWFLIIGILVTTILYSLLAADIHECVRDINWWIPTVCAVVNILCVVLSAKGSSLNFLFGVLFNLLYAIYCVRTSHMGNAAVYGLFFLPMQVVGYLQWKKIGTTGDAGQVAARRLTRRQIILVGAGCVVASALVYAILHMIGGNEAVLDAILTVLCVIAQILLTFAFAEQWYLWIIVNILTVVMWGVSAARGNGTQYDAIVVINYIFTLVNSINGLRVWLILSSRNEA